MSFLLDVDLIPISLAHSDYSLWSWNISAATEVQLWQQNISQYLETFYTWVVLSSTARWEVSSMWFSLQCATGWNNSYPCLLIFSGKSLMLHRYSVIVPYCSPNTTNWFKAQTAPSMPFHLAVFKFQDYFILSRCEIQEYLIHLTWSCNIQNPYYLL